MNMEHTDTATADNNLDLHILISGGGTGGHIFPAIAIANELHRRWPDAEILFVGAQGRMEMERVPAAGYRIVGLPVAGLDRKRIWRNFKVIVKLLKSMRLAKKILRDFKPDIAIGVGGYASGPMLKAAQKKGIPTLLQEQNSYAGVTNRLLAKRAAAICVAYDGMERFFPAGAIIKTGNPVRADILSNTMTREQAKEALGFSAGRPLVLVVGGSLGARSVNNAVAAALPAWENKDIQVLWQTGKNYIDDCQTAATGHKGVKATAFISDMATAFRAADLVVSRAGASTISELQLIGSPAVLIPSPNVAEDHQRHNALALADRGAAVMIPDNEATEQLADTVIQLTANPEKCLSMSNAIKNMALPDAAGKIADRVSEILDIKS